MKTGDDVFSVRLVVADFYMHRPIAALDPTYSDFRGHEIKTLPVIRIFGSKSNGEKTCMHVHGVFPYFYVPFLDGIVPDPDQLTYQIAASLDKALNISLGQTHSQSQHVFKIQLVKGRPFYGYHHKEHQFLKIFLYNPRFIKKAANLMLNGAILGKSFQPHESHVPFILQFFIDYNLYGMSFLHVPMEVVKYRQSDQFDLPADLPAEQVLSQNVTRVSTSRHEVDIVAAFILNRFQLLCKDSGNTNPGIESIWQDERVRRKKLSENQEVPVMEAPCSQERVWIKPTESDIFYRAALRAKLAMENNLDASLPPSTINTTINSDRKQKFNLVKLLENSVYPSECSQEMNATLVNASKVPDHLSSSSVFYPSMRARSKSRSSVSMDNSLLDEDLVLSLSQPRQRSMLDQTLQGEDLELLDVMQQLEEDEADVDLDSTLAPLSQIPKTDRKVLLDVSEENNEGAKAVNPNDSWDEEDIDALDYTISLDSVDKILLELSQPTPRSHQCPQLDGGDDWLSTPKKARSSRNSTKSKISPRSSKMGSTSKYVPLDITINKSPVTKRVEKSRDDPNKVLHITPFSVSSNGHLKRAATPTKVRFKGALINLNKEFESLRPRRSNGANVSQVNEKSFIVCNLKPRNSPHNLVTEETKPLSKNLKHTKVYQLRECRVKLRRLNFHKQVPINEIEKETASTSLKYEVLGVENSTNQNVEEDDGGTIPDYQEQETDIEAAEVIDMNGYQEHSEEKIDPLNEICDINEPIEHAKLLYLDSNGFGSPEIQVAQVTVQPPIEDAKMLHLDSNGYGSAEIQDAQVSFEPSIEQAKLLQLDANAFASPKIQAAQVTVQPPIHEAKLLHLDSNVFASPEICVAQVMVQPPIEQAQLLHMDSNIFGSSEIGVARVTVQPPIEQAKLLSVDENEFSSPDIQEAPVTVQPPIEQTKLLSLDANGFVKPEIRAVEVKVEPRSRRKSWSPSDVSREYDRLRNFFPKPGPSGLKKRRGRKKAETTPSARRQTRLTTKQQQQDDDCPKVESDIEKEEDLNICSFYDKSLIVDSPSTSIDFFSPQTPTAAQESDRNLAEDCEVQSIISNTAMQLVCITPRYHPPTFEEAMRTSVEFAIPDEVFTEPFYGDDADVTNKREVGHTVLHIPGRSLNACESFQSILPNLKGIEAWRKHLLESMLDENVTKNAQNHASVKEYFSSRERVVISAQHLPPSKLDADKWYKSLSVDYKRGLKQHPIEDSPIKVRQEKVKMIFDESILHDGNGDDCDFSQKSVSLSPLTPDNIKTRKTAVISSSKSKILTPIRRISDQTTPVSALQKFRERRKSRARLSLAKKLCRLGSGDSASSGADSELARSCPSITALALNVPQSISAVDLNESEKCSQRSSDSEQLNDLCSEKVMQILERTSFIRNLQSVEHGDGSDVSFGLSGATLDNTFGFKISLENLQDVKADVQHNYLTVFSLEIHVNTRGELKPNPEHDSVDCLFFSISSDCQESVDTAGKTTGCIMVCDSMNAALNGVKTRMIPVKTELELFNQLLELCQRWNPDILVGYEIEMSSWGYLVDRAQVLGMNLKALLSRVPTQKVRDVVQDEEKEAFTDLDVELKLCGRILLDVWRLMRSEIALTSYTFENVMFHILHRRCPMHSFGNLTRWYSVPSTRWIVLEYYLERVIGTMEILQQLDLIGRTSEMAKLIGIQFYEVLSRGSQFRVESMMLRIAKPKNFVPVSPSIQQRAHSRAPEYLPLILEPKSRFYADPMIVLDFQSLYPSMIIAYNYCFSTCLGRVEHLGQSAPFEFGCSQLRVSKSELKRLIDNDLVTISPCGVVFVKKEVREGVLPRMLKEILDTRIMVKQSMKLHKTNSTLQRVLHSRQLGLKLMANVTYGYTSANFSGRMACVEVADSVVGKGRETLERAIRLVESNKDWRAKVVYGDTDSLFVLVPGRSRTEAFRIGEAIAEAVTNENPKPVKLKLEKVYHPCILQTKKRYVGYMYESADQEKPEYEAKGIETVRRDGCPAVAKILEKCIRILFETCDVSQIKRYVCRQFTKLLTGNANVQDLIFAKEFRGKNGYKPGACVPALELTRKWLQTDPRSEPRRGERVPFLIVNGPPGLPLIRLVRSPHEYLADEGLKINAIYYITKAIIPPLNRCFLLIGADVNEWFSDLPRKHIILPTISISTSTKRLFTDTKKSTISQYFASSDCIIDCGRHTKVGVCNSCLQNKQKCAAVLSQKIAKLERGYFSTRTLCQSCCGRLNNIDCSSLDCPILFVAKLKERESKQVQHFENILREKICNA